MFAPRHARAAVFAALSASLVCLAFGCGGGKGYRVSGKVTFKGQPVPAGRISFIPDNKKGNSGATGYAEIKDGTYDTSAAGGHGSIGGPMIVKIEGHEPIQKNEKGEAKAKLLFPPYQTNVDLPKEDTTKDFEVPQAKGK